MIIVWAYISSKLSAPGLSHPWSTWQPTNSQQPKVRTAQSSPMVVFTLRHVPPFPEWPILYLSPGVPALRRHPDLCLLPHHTLAGTTGQGREWWGLIGIPHAQALPGPEKSSASSAGGGNKLLPNQPRPVVEEELQPPVSLGLQWYQTHLP